ncbi:MAG: hypothetical protein ACRYG7_37195 [Janthinobacterium lividum]
MKMPLRAGGIFSFSDKGHEGVIAFEQGSYGLDKAEVEAGAKFEDIIRLDGIGEFAVPAETVQAVAAMHGSQEFTAAHRIKALIGKMLEMGCRKVWSPPSH